jgi:hypothetical protein
VSGVVTEKCWYQEGVYQLGFHAIWACAHDSVGAIIIDGDGKLFVRGFVGCWGEQAVRSRQNMPRDVVEEMMRNSYCRDKVQPKTNNQANKTGTKLTPDVCASVLGAKKSPASHDNAGANIV